ncbi:class I SAM-dependent methyltransferase [Nocardia panacis]|uniref:Class I SAM-dependent methyltransferase n=1 Tax=Nocardia panacis TaxID=2340916 RepID=A0A3A4JRC5_9NOCA|nr:class I SAM-dependent methyltransferase [Nocardia panacis]RJO68201.1 class I SAM-dependent methyltransferase [Nocardia panacis]
MPVSPHTTGKASFDEIYRRPDPRGYYARMAELNYRIPELAKPYFERQLAEYRRATGVQTPTVLDICCSYGVNAAILRFGATMRGLTDYYAAEGDRAAMIHRDATRLAAADVGPEVRFVGLDASRPPLDYARDSGLLHETVHADLENSDPTPEQRRVLAGVDLVVSTGCVGYITERTLTRVAAADPVRRPWMAHFVLRMYGFETIAARLAGLGYRTVRAPGLFEQRRFASDDERDQVLNTLAAKGIDSTDCEADGWLYTHLYLSRPQTESEDPQ